MDNNQQPANLSIYAAISLFDLERVEIFGKFFKIPNMNSSSLGFEKSSLMALCSIRLILRSSLPRGIRTLWPTY
jgi:hypothetical protein